jgi:hypothetical protein
MHHKCEEIQKKVYGNFPDIFITRLNDTTCRNIVHTSGKLIILSSVGCNFAPVRCIPLPIFEEKIPSPEKRASPTKFFIAELNWLEQAAKFQQER